MREWDCLLTADYVLLLKQGEFVVEQNKSLGIKNGQIDFIGDLKPEHKAAKNFIFKDHLLSPGLINTHTHLPMSLFRGLADNIPLQDWLNEYIFPLENQFVDESFVKAGTLLSSLELIRSGITSFCDMYFYNESIAQAVKAAGLRGLIGIAIPSVEKDWHLWKDKFSQLKEVYRDYSKIQFAFAPHAPYTVSPDILKDIGEFAKAKKAPILIHASESEWEKNEIQKQYGKTPIRHLHDLGITGEKSLFAHCVHASKEDLEIMKKTKTAISYNPESNMKLSNGIAPITEAVREGLKVGLGTDGSASNNNLDFFGEMDTGLKLQSLKYGEKSLTASDMFKMATIKGAEALGLNEQIGSLEEGKLADIIAIDLKAPHFYPRYNLISHLVYAAKASDVSFVMCEGEVLMKDRKVQTLKEEEIFKEALEFENKIQQFLKNSK